VKVVAIIGTVAAIALIGLGSIDAHAALAGWLAAFALWSGVPLGALLLALMATLIPGGWRSETDVQARALVALLPLAVAAILPILIGVRDIYPWTEEAGRFYLNAGWFASRSIGFLAILLGFGAGLLILERPPVALAAGGVIAFVLLDTTLAVDWLMSLEPHFHSSGFGLYILAIQVNAALAVTVPMRLRFVEAKPELLGALMLTALLLWAYLAFMQYIISWSDDLPEPVRWYRHRGAGIWSAAEFAFCTLRLASLLLLFLSGVRRSPVWLRRIAAATLLATAIEMAWLVFPATATAAWLGAMTTLLGLAVLGATSIGCFAWARQGGLRWVRRPSP